MLFHNIRSAEAKLENTNNQNMNQKKIDIEANIAQQQNASLFALLETWSTKDTLTTQNSFYSGPNYPSTRNNGGRGGGSAILFHKNFQTKKYKLVPRLDTPSLLEEITVKVGGEFYTFIYKPHIKNSQGDEKKNQSNKQEKETEIRDHLEQIISKYHGVIMGDFNDFHVDNFCQDMDTAES
jgi:hypothetical protein